VLTDIFTVPRRFLSAEGLRQIGENGNVADVKSLARKALDVSQPYLVVLKTRVIFGFCGLFPSTPYQPLFFSVACVVEMWRRKCF